LAKSSRLCVISVSFCSGMGRKMGVSRAEGTR
jgi:hypothetical protein